MSNFGFDTTGTEIVEQFSDQVRGKTFLITGPGLNGVGAETAYCLAKAQPALLILAGRTESKIQPVLDRVKQDGVAVQFLPLDLSSQKSVRDAVGVLKGKGTKIDVLINNGGIMACPWALTEDGIEMQFGTNHVGHFLLTNLLLQGNLLGSCIVNVSSSSSMRRASYLLPHLDDLSYGDGRNYDPVAAYGVSKCAVNLSTRSLAAKLKSRNITVFSLHPGYIPSPLQRYFTPELREAASEAIKKESPSFTPQHPKSLQQGCATQLRAALDPSLRSDSGSYLQDCQVAIYPEHQEAYPAADKVWTISETLVGEKFDY